jgi:tetratricopeptide (TPR) repeat protein
LPDVIVIPGYRIERPLGRGGMSTVYLALQESVQREVALKIMSGTLLGDDEFGARFLREARIAASLRHPNVVHVYDVAEYGEHHYMAMEHLSGGPVLARRGPRRDFAFSLRVVREIASALDYAHRRDVVHRDIKPDNILLREDGSAVLTDFGIARAGDSMRMTRTGAIIGTPYYMSPEQARGQSLDGRADLYSLGVVFYQLLMGEVPYRADDSVAVGIMHITAPLPRLPATLAALQPLFDRLLAKDPEHRFQSGVELAAALDAIAHLQPELPSTPRERISRVPSPPLAADTPTVLTPLDAPADSPAGRGPRAEGPRLGAMEALAAGSISDQRRSQRRARKPSANRRWGAVGAALGVLLLLLAAAGFWYQQPLRALWSGSDRTEQLQRADRALQQGRLLDDAQGPGARSLFNAVLAAEPDHESAREGLRRVGRAHFDRAQAAAAASDLAGARRELEAARALGVAESEVSELEARLGRQSGDQSQMQALAQLIDAAEAARRGGQLEQPGSGAIAIFVQALAQDPGNAVARSGLRESLAPLLQRAQQSIADANYSEAERLLAVVAQADATHLELPELRGQLAAARQGRNEQISVLLAEARRRVARGDFATPVGSSAQEAYKAVLELDPDAVEARQGLRRLGTELLRRADAAAADFDFEAAESALDAASLLSPPIAGLVSARARIEDARARYGQIPIAGSADPARIASLLAAAQAALTEGRLLHPPGESAFDSLRMALRLDPSNVSAKVLLEQLPALAAERFEQAMAANQPSRALRYFEGLQGVAPTDSRLSAMRQRLAAAFIGLATERIGRGEVSPALQALERAAELEPNQVELPALRARLEQLGGG